MKYFYLRRKKDGKVLDIPERDVASTLKQGFELVGPIVLENITQGVTEVPTAPAHSCPICGYAAKSALGLMSHKKKHA